MGNYNGIILTDSDLAPGFTPSEWDILHNYERNFGVREAVLSGWPATYKDSRPPHGVYLDYGLVYSSSGDDYEGRWSVPAAYSKEVFEYVNQANPFPVADFAFAANPRNELMAHGMVLFLGLSRSSERKRAKPWYPLFGIWCPPEASPYGR